MARNFAQSVSQLQWEKAIGFAEPPITMDESSRINEYTENHRVAPLRLTAGRKFSPCPVSLTPWSMPSRLFTNAIVKAKALNQLLIAVSHQRDFLTHALMGFNDPASLLHRFKSIIAERNLSSQLAYRAQSINISRFDFLLTANQQWRLVESNSIAAGMGPFSEQLSQIYQALQPSIAHQLAPNPAIVRQADALFNAAQRNTQSASVNIVIVVEENENNIFDQYYLVNQLTHLGANILLQSFKQLSENLRSHDGSLLIEHFGQVSLFYFRTGYNLDDYALAGDVEHLIWLRQWIESHRVAVAPSIEQQVASSKWIQIQLSHLTAEEVMQQFGLSKQAAQNAVDALNTPYQLIESIQQVKSALQSREWLLKNQNEGGGNVYDQYSTLTSIQSVLHSSFLMKKIESKLRHNVTVLSDHNTHLHNDVISELGIFIVGGDVVRDSPLLDDSSDYAGYLLRSKAKDSMEAGVHNGDGFLDVIMLEENRASDRIEKVDVV